MSRLNPTQAQDAIAAVLRGAREDYKGKSRLRHKFLETIDLLITLKNYDVQKDKRFSGFVRLPVVARPNLRVCFIADAYHVKQCEELQIPYKTVEDLTKLKKNKKLVKKMTEEADAFLASEALIRQIPRLVGPAMTRTGKFPSSVAQGDDIKAKVEETRATVKFALKKVLCLGAGIGHVRMSSEDVRRNLFLSLNFLASLLKKGWQNIKSVYIKSTMGAPQVRCALLWSP